MKNLRRIREFLGTRHGIRVISVVAAVAVWYAIRTATSNSTLVTDIPLAIQPPPDWSVVDCSAKTIDVAFLGTRDDLRYLNRELIKATVDARGRKQGVINGNYPRAVEKNILEIWRPNGLAS